MLSDAEKLKAFRVNRGLSQSQLADSVGVKQQIIAMVEKGSRKAPSSLKLGFIKAFGVDFETQILSSETLSYEQLNNPTPINCVPIPFYSVKAAAGSGETLPDYPEKDVIYFDARWLKNIIGINAKNATIIQAKGDSMDSGQNKFDDIKNGDLLMIDDSVKEIINNKIFVIRLSESELVVKRVFQELDGTISLISNNPKYADRVINECDGAMIVGKVVWNGSKENI